MACNSPSRVALADGVLSQARQRGGPEIWGHSVLVSILVQGTETRTGFGTGEEGGLQSGGQNKE